MIRCAAFVGIVISLALAGCESNPIPLNETPSPSPTAMSRFSKMAPDTHFRPVGSVVERSLDMGEVRGSIPLPGTTLTR